MSPGQFRALPEDEQQEILDYQREVCPSCGNLRSVCEDPDRLWYPQRSVCWATASRENVVRRLNEKRRDVEPDRGYLPSDGEHIWVSTHDLTPEADWL
jgi:hypothetical protein